MAVSRVSDMERHTPAFQESRESPPSVGSPGRRELRGLTHTGQRRALSPSNRFQVAARSHVRHQLPVSTGYAPPGAQDREALVLAGNEALSRLSQSLCAARVVLDHAGHTALGTKMVAYGSRAGLLGTKLPGIGNLAAVVCALVEAAEALDRGDLRRATDVLASGVLNALLGCHPWTAVPAAALSASLGSDWPSQLIHHLAGTDDPEFLSGAAYLGTP
jgi:hypothetical protein